MHSETKMQPIPQSTFWLRIIAAIFDWMILSIIGWLSGNYFESWFAGLGRQGIFIGFLLALSYYGFFNSRWGEGQTPGKRLLGLRVVDANGETISFMRASGRAIIFVIPLLLSGITFYPLLESEMELHLYHMFLAMLVWGAALCQAYLFIINTPTRQVLHDIVFATYVIHEKADVPAVYYKPVTWLHYISLVVILLLVFAASLIFDNRMIRLTPYQTFAPIVAAVDELGYFSSVRLFVDTVQSPRGDTDCLFIHVVLKKDMIPRAVVFQKIIDTVLKYKYVRDLGMIDITIDYGNNIGIMQFTSGTTMYFETIK